MIMPTTKKKKQGEALLCVSVHIHRQEALLCVSLCKQWGGYHNIVECIVIANGMYDIASAISILVFTRMPLLNLLGRLHTQMFLFEDALSSRLLAYWILTYGCIRMAIIARNTLTHCLVMASYFIEAAVYLVEDVVHASVHTWKATWVVFSSCLLLAICFHSMKRGTMMS